MSNQKDLLTLISPHGGYRDLQSYERSDSVYDGRVVFCDRFIARHLASTSKLSARTTIPGLKKRF